MGIIPPDILGVVFALTSALVWGSADFSGGFATRRNNPFQVLVLSSSSGIVVLILCALVWGEHLPSLASTGWAALAGVAGVLGLAALYQGLSVGNAASVAPTAAVVGAASPVVFGLFTEGLPKETQLVGFILALCGIWLVTQTTASENNSRRGTGLAWLAGISFGAFFILLAQVEREVVFTPLVIAKSVSLLTAFFLLFIKRISLPGIRANPTALLAGALDVGGNVFYLLAKHYTRLDVAVVLSSLYPATTVLLARFVLNEKATRAQWIGAGLCLAAVVLIAL